MQLQSVTKAGFTLILVGIAVSGCEGARFRSREKGALAGGALGAGLGAIVGNQVGSTGAGIAIGSAFGAVSGGLIGNEMDVQDDRFADNDRRLADQEHELAENRRLINELRASGVDAKETSRGLVMNLPDVLFEFDSSRLTADSHRKIQGIADALKRSPDRAVAVEGHTDSVGTAAYNQRLSDDRARSAARALESEGISRNRMSVRGYGESRPIASNASSSGRSQNRRVEVILEKRR